MELKLSLFLFANVFEAFVSVNASNGVGLFAVVATQLYAFAGLFYNMRCWHMFFFNIGDAGGVATGDAIGDDCAKLRTKFFADAAIADEAYGCLWGDEGNRFVLFWRELVLCMNFDDIFVRLSAVWCGEVTGDD